MRWLRVSLSFVIGLAVLLPPGRTASAQEEPFTCRSGEDYEEFDPDYSGVTEVCPAHTNNYSTSGFNDRGPLHIVIHHTGNADATAIQGNINRFQNGDIGLSSHYMVGLDDNGNVHVIQLVREIHMAHHAGDVINLNGVPIDNSNSIGIEVVGQGDLAGWPADSVYSAVADLVSDIVQRAKANNRTIELSRNYIVGHEEISTTGKWDPGPYWDWQRFMEDEMEGSYAPVANLRANRNAASNSVNLSIEARYNGRTAYRIELSADEGAYAPVESIRPITNDADTRRVNPAVFNLITYTPPPSEWPIEHCYQAIALRNTTAYVNPSSPACVIVGPAGYEYDLPRRDSAIAAQSIYPIVAPGEQVNLTFTLRNTGILSWKNNGSYVLINTGGESFGLETRLPVPTLVLPTREIAWELPFTAPENIGAHYTTWQMAYLDPDMGNINLFGREISYLVTVVPGGASSDLGQMIRQVIDQAINSATEPLENILDDLRRRVDEEIARRTPWWVRCLNSLAGPGLVLTGAVFWNHKKRKSRP